MRPLLSALILSCCFVGLPPAHAQQPAPAQPLPAEQPVPPSSGAPSAPVSNPPVQHTSAPPSAGSTTEPQTPLPTDTSQFVGSQAKQNSNAPAAFQPGSDPFVATLDANGKPIDLPPCAHKDKECIKKRKTLLHHKELGMKIENGTLTVDGWTGKARLNYDIHDVKFLYVSVPGVGTVVASVQQFPNSVQQKDALDGKVLTLKTPGDHIVQLSSDEILADKKEHVFFVALDKNYVQPGRFPTLGYGTVAQAPYNWPGARPMTATEQKQSASAPPLPSGMLAAQVQLPCQKVSPGQKPTPVKLNGVAITPAACKVTPATPSAATTPAGTDEASSVTTTATRNQR